MGTAIPLSRRDGGHGSAGGLYPSSNSDDIAALDDQSERYVSLAARVSDCVDRAFEAMGLSPRTREMVFWDLRATKNIGRDEVIDKPAEFIDGIKTIFGEAGTGDFEHRLAKEIRREFGIPASLFKKEQPARPRDIADLVHLVAFVALG